MSTKESQRMREVLTLLAEETDQLRRLHRLAHRQRHYMIRQDARRVRWTAEQIEAGLPLMRELAQRRIQAVEAALDGRGRSLKELVELADTDWRGAVTDAVRGLAEAGDQLHRKNFMNYQLASYSIDLTQEEMRLLVGGQDEGDAYSPDGQKATGDLNAVLDGRV